MSHQVVVPELHVLEVHALQEVRKYPGRVLDPNTIIAAVEGGGGGGFHGSGGGLNSVTMSKILEAWSKATKIEGG